MKTFSQLEFHITDWQFLFLFLFYFFILNKPEVISLFHLQWLCRLLFPPVSLGTLGYAGYVLVSRIVCKRENVICETQIALRGSSRGQRGAGKMTAVEENRARGWPVRSPFSVVCCSYCPSHSGTCIRHQGWCSLKLNSLKWLHGVLFACLLFCLKNDN